MSFARMATRRLKATPIILASDEDIREGIRWLRRRCKVVRTMHDAAGDPSLRRRQAGFDGLARIVVGQQLSVASAAAIWGRTEAAVQPFTPARLAAIADAPLRAAGLSVGKVRTLRAIASAVSDGSLDLDRLDRASDEDVHAALTAVSGIGPWTADVYIMFCLGRADAFASGDLALQIALQLAAGLDSRPSSKELLAFAERWRPWRSVAAHLLWAYYKVAKVPTSGLPV